jgi:membrane protease YdiL (CAAX protease family)
MNSLSPLTRLANGFQAAFAEAGQSPFLTYQPVTRPLLRLLGIVAFSTAGLVTLITLLGLGLSAGTEAAPALLSHEMLSQPIPDSPDRLHRESAFLVILAFTLMGAALVILAAASIMHDRPISDFQWPGRKPSLQLLLSGFVLMVLVSLLLWPAGWLIEGRISPAPILNNLYTLDSRLLYLLVASLMVFIAAAAEEIVFRGIVLRTLGGLTRKAWLLVLLNGLLFSMLHLDPDPVAFVARAVSGAVWTWAALRLAGIEFAIGAHCANNLVIVLLGAPMSDAAAVDQRISAVYLLPELVSAVIIVTATEVIARRRRMPLNTDPAQV